MRPILPLFAVIAAMATSNPVFAADAEFDSFWARFKNAVIKNDKQTVASLTKLPYMFDCKMLNRQQFLDKYSIIFPKAAVACLKTEKPSRDQSIYEVFCGEQIYIFGKEKGKWLFTEIGVND